MRAKRDVSDLNLPVLDGGVFFCSSPEEQEANFRRRWQMNARSAAEIQIAGVQIETEKRGIKPRFVAGRSSATMLARSPSVLLGIIPLIFPRRTAKAQGVASLPRLADPRHWPQSRSVRWAGAWERACAMRHARIFRIDVRKRCLEVGISNLTINHETHCNSHTCRGARIADN